MELTKFVDKYAPKNLSDMILSDDLKKYFKEMVDSGKFVNCSLIASPGIGKTTLAKTLAKEANAEVLFMACASGDGKVESIQTKLIPFTNSLPIENKPMFVILDELDSASAMQDSSFQKALRNVIEASPSVVYIATANYGQKILPAILSRCPAINLSYTPKQVLLRIKYILDTEKISYTKSELSKFVKFAIKKYYPDIRSILNILQGCCSSGCLKVADDAIAESISFDVIKDLVSFVFENKGDVLAIRKYYLQMKSKIQDYESFASSIFNYVMNLENIAFDKETIVKMADVIYQMGIVVDKEISFFQFIVVMSNFKQKQING